VPVTGLSRMLVGSPPLAEAGEEQSLIVNPQRFDGHLDPARPGGADGPLDRQNQFIVDGIILDLGVEHHRDTITSTDVDGSDKPELDDAAAQLGFSDASERVDDLGLRHGHVL